MQRRQLPSNTDINPHICKVTLPAHTKAIGQELRRQGILYVDDKKVLVAPPRRIQCSSLHGRCIVRELMIAPGGCHVAYTPGDGHDRSFISLNLCPPEAP